MIEKGSDGIFFLFQKIIIFSYKNYIDINGKYFLNIAYLCDLPFIFYMDVL